jgi:hypothetical protein
MPKPTVDDKAEVEFLYLKVKGGSHALQEAVRTFANTLTRSQPARPVLPAATSLAHRVPTANDPVPVEEQQPSLFGRDAASDVDVGATGEEIETATPARARVPRPRPIPEIIPDLDIMLGDVPLKEYAEKKGPQTDFDKTLVVASWLREYKNVNSISVSHVFTCFSGMGWRIPPDLSGPLRDLAKRKRQFLKGDGAGNYSLTIPGLNAVAQMGVNPAA